MYLNRWENGFWIYTPGVIIEEAPFYNQNHLGFDFDYKKVISVLK